MKKYILFLVIAVITFTACQKVVDTDKLLDTSPRVFITGYLSPSDTVFRVNVSRAFSSVGTPLSVNDNEENRSKFLIRDAQVTLSDENDNSINLAYSEAYENYFADANTLTIKTNDRYFLNVVVDGQEYTASCTIPEKVKEIAYETTRIPTEYNEDLVNITFTFQDIPGQQNFYILGGFLEGIYQSEGQEPKTNKNPIYWGSDTFQTDNLEDGGTLSGTCQSCVFIPKEGEENNSKLILQVAQVEEILYQGLRSEAINVDADGDPFIEYSVAPNNFSGEGVIGIFAGYQLTEQEVVIDR